MRERIGKIRTGISRISFVFTVGCQARGSLGRQLIDGAKQVHIFGEKIVVNATIRTRGGFSARAGQADLLNGVRAIAPSKPQMVLIYGEDSQRQTLSESIKKQFKLKTLLPMQGDIIEL